MSSDWVARLEQRLLPQLGAIADELAAEFPAVDISVYCGPVGNLTEWQGHDFGIDCVFDRAKAEVSDNLALTIDLAHLTTRPQLTGLDVYWGYPDATHELALISDPVDLDDAALDRIEAALPQLVAALRSALARGRPA
jgi:hypothetical protein